MAITFHKDSTVSLGSFIQVLATGRLIGRILRAALRDDDLLVGLAMDHHGNAAAYRELRHRQARRDDDAQVVAEDDGVRLDGAQ